MHLYDKRCGRYLLVCMSYGLPLLEHDDGNGFTFSQNIWLTCELTVLDVVLLTINILSVIKCW